MPTTRVEAKRRRFSGIRLSFGRNGRLAVVVVVAGERSGATVGLAEKVK